ncbi:MAG: PD-(D/E)XK nuclease family protein, partial [Victivallales bacterium]|nr:PD-(D/E)XK nuclease family protein [Victivallales bacterium]
GKQWEIFNKLFASVGHLIVVGDPKQAIYGFRGADLATYLKAKNELLHNDGQFEQLNKMYRSTREMVDDFNTIFKTGWFDNMEEGSYSIKYEEVHFPNENPPEKVSGFNYPTDEKAVELLEAGSGLKEFLENAANEMIRLNRNTANVYTVPIHDREGKLQMMPLMNWNDMCVLVRSHADSILARDTLIEKGIPCRIYKEPGAFDDVEAESILALFDYLSQARSLGNLSALLLTPLWDVKPEMLEQRLKTGDAGFDRLCRKWRNYAQKRDWKHLFESVIKNTKIQQNASGYRQIFDVLLTQYGHAQSLSELATALRQLKSGDEVAGENGTYRNRTSEDPAVQIMTMHAAKGLEANAVFVAAGFSGKAMDGESKRLFYVALTRAVFKLYLPWSNNIPDGGLGNNNSALQNYLGTALKKLLEGGDRMRNTVEQEIVPSGCGSQSSNDDKKAVPPSRGMKGWRFKWDSFSSLCHHKKTTAPNVLDASTLGDEPQDNEVPELYIPKQESLVSKGNVSGTVFHEVMEKLCANDGTGDCIGFEIGKTDDFNTLIDEKDGRKSPLLEIVRRRLAANGVPNRLGKKEGESTAVSLARMAWNALRTELIFNGDKFRLCDIELKDRKAEVNFVIDESLLLGNCKDREGALNGDIDLLLRHNNAYYIIDWKTNSLDDYKPETVKQAMDDVGYHWQYSIYILAAEKWLDAKVNGAAYLFVRGGEFADNAPSGIFLHSMNDDERDNFAKKLAERLAESDLEERNEEQEEL